MDTIKSISLDSKIRLESTALFLISVNQMLFQYRELHSSINKRSYFKLIGALDYNSNRQIIRNTRNRINQLKYGN